MNAERLKMWVHIGFSNECQNSLKITYLYYALTFGPQCCRAKLKGKIFVKKFNLFEYSLDWTGVHLPMTGWLMY